MTPTRSKKPRRGPLAHFVPEDWTVSRELYDWATGAGFNHAEIVLQAELFVDHEFDKPRSDWNRAFQNWLRKSRQWGEGRRAKA